MQEQIKTYYCPICNKEYTILVKSNVTSGHCECCGHHVVLN